MSKLAVRLMLHGLLPVIVGVAAAKLSVPRAGEGGKAVEKGPRLPGRASSGETSVVSRAAGALSEQQAFIEKLRGASLDRLKDLADEANGMADAFRRRWARDLVMEQMARTDPVESAAFFKTWCDGGYRKYFLAAWGRVDAVGAVTWTQAQGKEGKDLTYELVKTFVPENIDAYLKVLPMLKPEHIPSDQTGGAFRMLAEEDSANALKLADTLPAGSKQNAAFNAVGEGWARRSPKAAWDWAQALKDPAARESALRGVLTAWAETDPAGAATKLAELSPEPIKGADGKDAVKGYPPLKAVVRQWATVDPKAAAAWLRSRESSNDGEFKDLLLHEILPTRDVWDPVELTEIIRKPGGEPLPENAKSLMSSSSWTTRDDVSYRLYGVYGGSQSPLGGEGYEVSGQSAFAVEDPAKAFDAVSKMPGDASRQHMLQELADQWATSDPQAALGRLKETTDPFLRLSLVNALRNEGARRGDPSLAEGIAATRPKDSTERNFSTDTSEIYRRLAQNDPEKALALLNSDVPKAARWAMASSLAARQAEYDPAGAMAWANQQPEAWRAASAQAAMEKWAEADSFGASEWLAAQPAGPARDAAVNGLISHLRNTSSEDALEWSKALSDPVQRENQQASIIRNLVYRDTFRARRLLEASSLTGPARQQVEASLSAQEKSR